MPQVIMDRLYTYELDGGRRRTLPRGWRGEVGPKVAQAIKTGGFGRVLGGQGAAGARKTENAQGASGARKAESGPGGGGAAA